jgi:hypothetical protein
MAIIPHCDELQGGKVAAERYYDELSRGKEAIISPYDGL